MNDRTFVIIKPDAVERGIAGEIIARFEKKGLKIVGLEYRQLDEKILAKHYAEHKGKGFYAELVAFMSRSPAITMVLEGPKDTWSAVRTMMGATNPMAAAPGTIRGDFGTLFTENQVHGSDGPESALREIKIFFPKLAK
jgi:nucleoside-diphosphate kinase